MEPTLLDGDRLLVLRAPAPLVRLRAGQLVLARPRALGGRDIIKRLHAIDGDGRSAMHYLRGDNPLSSTDSRHFGPVARVEIAGVVLLRYWPDQRGGCIR